MTSREELVCASRDHVRLHRRLITSGRPGISSGTGTSSDRWPRPACRASSRNRNRLLQREVIASYSTTTKFCKVGTVLRQVLVQRLKTITRYRYLLPLVPLAMHDQQTKLAIYITEPQTNYLATTQASIDQNDHRETIQRGR